MKDDYYNVDNGLTSSSRFEGEEQSHFIVSMIMTYIDSAIFFFTHNGKTENF